jgi:acetyltransferase (GNAT) family protein
MSAAGALRLEPRRPRPDSRLGIFSAHITYTPECVSVYMTLPTEPRAVAVAEASRLLPEKGGWYVNRVLVSKKEDRGKGLGSYVLGLLIQTVRRTKDFSLLLVEPGGYDNNVKAQRAFYRKNGFCLRKYQDGQAYIFK